MGDLSRSTLARALGDEPSGQGVLCPGPGHLRNDRSLSVRLNPTAPGGIVVFSFAGDGWQTCKDHVRERLGMAPFGHEPGAPPKRLKLQPTQHRLSDFRDLALDIFRAARNPYDTIAERYLTRPKAEGGRGLKELPDDIAGRVLRFHPCCPWQYEDGALIEVPALIGLMRCIQTDKPMAIHRRRLTPDGQKVGKPRMLGPSRGTAVKFDADENVEQGLVIGKGVETYLSAWQVGLRPVWALGSVNAIRLLPVLSGVDALTILAENDPNNINAKAIRDCTTIWDAAGREVLRIDPRVGSNLNDALQLEGFEDGGSDD